MTLWSLICEKRHEQVQRLERQALGLGILTTRRQARKALSGRGSLMAKILAAEAQRAKVEGR